MTDTMAFLLERLHRRRKTVASALYAFLTAVCYAAAYSLRFEFSVPPQYARLFLLTVPLLVIIRLVTQRLFRLTSERWRYAGANDIGRLFGSTVLGTILFAAMVAALPLPDRIPVSVLFMEAVLTGYAIGGMWLSYRLVFEYLRRSQRSDSVQRRTLIVGAGEAGTLLAREMLRSRILYEPIGFVDDDPAMWGATIHGLKVFGATAELPRLARQHAAEKIIIAVPSADPGDLRRIVALCEETHLPFKVLPGVAAVITGKVTLQQLREVRIEDLLGREPIELALPELAQDLKGRTVLITGAAGSIGSELARQVALHGPRCLLLLDQAETPLFYLELELRQRHSELSIVPVVGDIVDDAGMDRLFQQHMPERVFHAAAYKHVPIMELNVREAIRNNVLGTLRIGELAGRYGAERFILVSTDKAVRPTNVMGATKRIAELIVLELQQRYRQTTYGAVRFGNVLGSQGSVIPIFRRQLEQGRPLTVTHPETTRYFMTIPEAVQLILQASLLPDLRGRIAMLEMGEPVRILDLAMNLLRLSGVPDDPGRIVFTGLRPGEKLHEELSAPDEQSETTVIPKVRLLQTPSTPVLAVLARCSEWEGEFDESLLIALAAMFPAIDTVALAASRRKPSLDEPAIGIRAHA